MTQKIKLSVVIPAYNEEHNLKRGVLRLVADYLSRQKYAWEVLVVDDGSTDGTARLASDFAKKNKGFKVLKEPHRGKAGTVIAGMLKARGDIVLFADMDQSTPLDQVEKFLPEFDRGADVVIGSRSGRKGAPFSRKVMAFGFALLRTLVLRLPFRDTQTGFKAFTKRANKKLFTKMHEINKGRVFSGASVTAGFDIEFLYIARKMGLKVKEVPVSWQYEEGASGKSAVKGAIDGLKGIIAVRMNSWSGRYKI